MSAILNDVAIYLSGQLNELVMGTSLFRDRLPSTLPTCTALIEESGTLSNRGHHEFFKSVDGPVYRVRHSELKVQVRKPRKLDAELLAGQINILLIDLQDDLFSSFRLNRIEYVDGPVFFPEIVMVGGSRTYMFVSSFIVHYEDTGVATIA